MKQDPEKHRAWQERSRLRAIERLREKGRKFAPREPQEPRRAPSGSNPVRKPARPKKSSQRPNDGPWRAACIALRGEICRSCGDTSHIEMDHVIPKSQDPTARADVENGLPLCGAFSRNTPGGCHPAKTAGRLQFEWDWFDADQIEYLKAKGWVEWDPDGSPRGRGMKHFKPKRGLKHTTEGGPDDQDS